MIRGEIPRQPLLVPGHETKPGTGPQPNRCGFCAFGYTDHMRSEILRIVFGFCLLLILAGLALAIALGKVEEKSSYGLMPLLVALAGLGGQFAQWCFGAGRKDE